MEISIIIVNYQSEVFLKKCLDSLRKNIPTELAEVIVVNNDPVALSLAADYNFFNLRIINQIANVGFAQACNAGAAIANGKFLFFLNPDTELNFSNIYDLIAKLDEPGVGIIAPKLITPKGEAQPWSAGLDINLWSVLKNNIRPSQSKRFWQNNSASQAAWVSGAAMLISKKLFDLCNGFDEKFFMYFEDIDLCKRVRAQGQQILRLPQFSVLHIGSQSYCESKKQKEQYYTSQDYYFKKHFGFCSLFLLRSLRSLMLLCKKS